MNLVFSIEGKEAYKLVKRDPGWELMEWQEERISEGIRNKGATIPARWEKMNKGNGCYPSSVDHALSIMAERLYDRKPRLTLKAVDGLEEIHRMLRTIDYQVEHLTDRVKDEL